MIDRKPLPSFVDLRTQFIYDPETGVLQYRKKKNRKRLLNTEAGRVITASTGTRYRIVTVEYSDKPSESVFAHRVAWKLETGEEPPEQIDHRDGNGLNNAFTNLRDGTGCNNARNSAMNKNNTSGYNGVVAVKGGRYLVRLKCEGEDIYIGRFKDLHEAGKAARNARLEKGFTLRHGLPKKNLQNRVDTVE